MHRGQTLAPAMGQPRGEAPPKQTASCQELFRMPKARRQGPDRKGSIVSPDLKSQGSGKPDFSSKLPPPGIDLILRMAIPTFRNCPEWLLQPCSHRILKHQHAF